MVRQTCNTLYYIVWYWDGDFFAIEECCGWLYLTDSRVFLLDSTETRESRWAINVWRRVACHLRRCCHSWPDLTSEN